jgi:predicted enzyme related to lactoylglutathione lyase
MRAMGVPPCWTGYVGVRELEPVIEKLTSLGGSVRRPATDIPEVGRFAVVADPQGAAFILFQPKAGAEPPPLGDPRPGHVTWRELMTTDWEKGFAFYSELFGWTKFGEHDMGPMGTYLLFAINGERAGGMMNGGPQCPGSFWGYYVLTDSVAAAAERVTSSGGQVLMGPIQVPDGQWVIQALDPQGAHFAMVGPQ